ncbi:hypothetical protein ACN23B_03365 [Anabaena sp. FACHB-709]|uniref:Uncharacterized protein n=2 Tax=Nostocaceae TaxID=1162 RepID=A0A1Z4KRX8_ANAVA|nr:MULTISPECIES: hypothetical protein [Nostocaceae]BAY71651.1 hypothetical protein NIES23_44710 [Trichormus variabilis NIES-23]HBW31160.1 hypothetical protein [Nostoc sp. UBA8866]MBD2172501.1 hypothetical protein [Anabaena cylindrica FACHB-318]MBD2264032.1 hypothetical protein [Anabaena sp. FACHB-709]MBD2273440.1 hypothetical protein [Nostoc sp. PCC 7120 = FACHB-418]
MKLSKLYVLPLASVIVLIGILFVKTPTAQSSDCHQASYALNNSKAADDIVHTDVIEEGQVFVVQTRSKGVKIIEAGKVMTTTKSFLVTIKDEKGKIIRVFQGLGRGSDLIATAKMSKAEAVQLLESGGLIVEEIEGQ